MGSAGKMMVKLARGAGLVKKKGPAAQIINTAATVAGADVKGMADKLRSERGERGEAARRRGRRIGRRGLMMAGRLGGGGQEEETKTTLG